MKRYMIAVIISLLLNLFLIGFISMQWGHGPQQISSVELIFDSSDGSLFHDDIVSDGLTLGERKASLNQGGKGGESGAGLAGSNHLNLQEQPKAVELKSSRVVKNQPGGWRKVELPSEPSGNKTNTPNALLNGEDKGVPPSKAEDASPVDNDPAKTEQVKTAVAKSGVGQGDPNSSSEGTGGGKGHGTGPYDGGEGEGSGDSGYGSGGSGSGNGKETGEGLPGISGGGSASAKLNPPVPIKEVYPIYPREAREKGWEGRTYLKITIDRKGRVIEVKVLEFSGYEVLDKEAMKAAWRLRYKPATRNGVSVEWYIKKAFVFKLQ